MSTSAPGGSVIHDLGYRGYDGARLGTGSIARSLFTLGLRHAYGLGRSGRSRVLPFLLLAFATLPAAVMIGIVAFTGFDIGTGYAAYPDQVQTIISVFAAAQAPVLFSRDLQHRSIVLYSARPLSIGWYAVVRWLSLTAAIALFILGPVLVLYVGGLLTGLDPATHTAAFAKAAAAMVVLAAMLAAITGVISTLSTRRGLAVVASIALLVFGPGAVVLVQQLALDRGADAIAQLAGLASPYSIYTGVLHLIDPDVSSFAPPDSPLFNALYVGAAVAIPVLGLALLVLRLRSVASR